MKAAERAARIDQRLTDLRARCQEAPELLRWLGDVEHDVRALADQAAATDDLQQQLTALGAELRRVDLDRQLIADAAVHLIDQRRGTAS